MALKHLLIFAILALLVALASLSEAAPKSQKRIVIPVDVGLQNSLPSGGNNGISSSQPSQTPTSTSASASASQSATTASTTTSSGANSASPTPTGSTNSTSGTNSTTSGPASTASGSSTPSSSSKETPTKPSKENQAGPSTSVVVVSVQTPNNNGYDSSDASIVYSINLVSVLFILITSSIILI